MDGARSEDPLRSADPLQFLDEELSQLHRAGLLREPAGVGERSGLLDLCSNDYLGYAAEPWAGVPLRGGAGASRLVTGNHAAHEAAEAALASWLGAEAALLFSSGYAANVGTISALARPGDVVVSDALNHASIIDGCRLSGAKVLVTEHRNLEAVGAALSSTSTARRQWVVTESYFSMDGDSPDLAGLRQLCDSHGAALMVDEAHALGVFGDRGRGLCAAAGVRPDVLVGTCGKALGSQGAFVIGSNLLRLWLWNRARSFVFSTGVSPALARQIEGRVHRVAEDEAGRARLARVEARLREGLLRLGAPLGAGRGPVIPWVLGAPEEALGLSARLRADGILVQPIRPPTVPAGTSRVRITANACLSDGDVDRALAAFARAVGRGDGA